MGLERPHNGTLADVWTSSTPGVSEVVDAESPGRAYAILIADPDNAGPVWINFHNDAEVGKGIPIFPGGDYELNDTNLTMTAINAIAAGAGYKLYTAIGKG